MSENLQQANTNQQGRMRVLRTRLRYSDDGGAVTLGVLPAGSLLMALYAYVEETFDDSGTDTLVVGRTGDGDAYAKTVDVDLTSTGLTTSFTGDEAMPQVVSAETTITAEYAGQNDDATQGAVTVTIVYGTCGI